MTRSGTRRHYLEITAIVIALWVDNHQGDRPLEDTLFLQLSKAVSIHRSAGLVVPFTYLYVHPFLFLKPFVLAHEPSLRSQGRGHSARLVVPECDWESGLGEISNYVTAGPSVRPFTTGTAVEEKDAWNWTELLVDGKSMHGVGRQPVRRKLKGKRNQVSEVDVDTRLFEGDGEKARDEADLECFSK